MKGKYSRYERETTIVFNEEEDKATIWTASEPIYRRLKKAGYKPVEDNAHSARFEVPKRDIRLPKPPSKARIAQGKARFGRFPEAIATDQSSEEAVVVGR